MSKTTLKKELLTMSHEQLVQIILDTYDANAEFKEYYEYFLNPDEKKLIEKHLKLLRKEFSRSKWGSSKARTSIIKAVLKHFMGFNPSAESVLKIHFLTLRLLGLTERSLYISSTHYKYLGTLVTQIVSYAEQNQMAANTLQKFYDELNYQYYTDDFKEYLQDYINKAYDM